MKTKYNIKDIANKAGVSIGTVDRVIHGRGGVSEKSSIKVKNAMKELDYSPNPIARLLKNNRSFRIEVLIPDPKLDQYWTPCLEAIDALIHEHDAFNIEINTAFFNPSSPDSFIESSKRMMANSMDAALFVPLFDIESDVLTLDLKAKEIPFATFNSPPRTGMSHHVGQDLWLSGRVAGKLMSSLIEPGTQIAVLHIDETFGNAIHMQKKERGFRDFFRENYFDNKVFTIATSSQMVYGELKKAIDANERVGAVFVTNSKTYVLNEYFKNFNPKLKVIGYDLLPENVEGLKEGHIDYLIYQAPREQLYQSLKNLIENLLFSKEMPTKVHLPIEIVNSENLESYF